MSDELIVLTASTVGPNHPESGTLALYLSQLEAAGIDHHCETLKDFPANGGSLGYKVDGLRRRVAQFLHYDKIIFTDGHDVQFFGKRADVLRKIPSSGVLLAGERNCYPEPSLIEKIAGPSPWRFANGGMLCGTPESFLEWLSAIERHPEFDLIVLDQAWLNRRLAEGSPLVKLDTETELFYCFYYEGEELQFEDGLPVNTVFGTHPNFCHANGKWPCEHIYARRTRSLNEPSSHSDAQ